MPETNRYAAIKEEEQQDEEAPPPSSSPPPSSPPLQKFVEGMKVLKEDSLQLLLVVIYSLTSFANGALFAVFLFSLTEPADMGGVGLTTLGAGLFFSYFILF